MEPHGLGARMPWMPGCQGRALDASSLGSLRCMGNPSSLSSEVRRVLPEVPRGEPRPGIEAGVLLGGTWAAGGAGRGQALRKPQGRPQERPQGRPLPSGRREDSYE